MLMTNSEIASIAEPWILLPFFYAERKSGIYTEYNQAWSKIAVSDFILSLPNGMADYREELREFIIRLYSRHCPNGESYFLDKTPRYYLIIKEIAELFPDAKFIFLFRNPVEILGSILSTWSKNTLKKIHYYEVELKQAPKLLSEGYSFLKDRAHSINYKNLLTNPKKELEEICEYLEIPFQETMTTEFVKMRPKGRMVDPTGTTAYASLNPETFNKWPHLINSLAKKIFFRKYVESLDESVLLKFGYKKDYLISIIDKIPVCKICSLKDWFYWIRGRIILRFRLNLLISRNRDKNGKNYLS